MILLRGLKNPSPSNAVAKYLRLETASNILMQSQMNQTVTYVFAQPSFTRSHSGRSPLIVTAPILPRTRPDFIPSHSVFILTASSQSPRGSSHPDSNPPYLFFSRGVPAASIHPQNAFSQRYSEMDRNTPNEEPPPLAPFRYIPPPLPTPGLYSRQLRRFVYVIFPSHCACCAKITLRRVVSHCPAVCNQKLALYPI